MRKFIASMFIVVGISAFVAAPASAGYFDGSRAMTDGMFDGSR